jgi:hypothetical protein
MNKYIKFTLKKKTPISSKKEEKGKTEAHSCQVIYPEVRKATLVTLFLIPDSSST